MLLLSNVSFNLVFRFANKAHYQTKSLLLKKIQLMELSVKIMILLYYLLKNIKINVKKKGNLPFFTLRDGRRLMERFH